MKKLKLEYEFDLDHDKWEYQNIVNANKYRSMLKEIFIQFRTLSKHHGTEGNFTTTYDMLWGIANDEEINPWEEIF